MSEGIADADIPEIEAAPRKAGDPLECECPVCTRVKRIVQITASFEDVGEGVGLLVSEDGLRGPEDRPGAHGPDLKQAVGIAPAETSLNVGRRTADHAEEDVPDSKSRRLTVVGGVAWSGDGRWI